MFVVLMVYTCFKIIYTSDIITIYYKPIGVVLISLYIINILYIINGYKRRQASYIKFNYIDKSKQYYHAAIILISF